MSTTPTTMGRRAAEGTGGGTVAARGRGRGKGRWLAMGTVAAAIAAGAVFLLADGRSGLFAGGEPDGAAAAPYLFEVKRADLEVAVEQKGTIEARDKRIIKSQVKGRVEVAEIIEEGTVVDQGQLIVRLDDTDLQDQKRDQEQKLDNARSSKTAAEVNLKNTVSQTDSDIAKATLDVEFAKLALRKYLEGEYPQQLKNAQADVEIARETYKRESDRAAWSKRLLAQGFITESEADADAAAANKAKLDLEIAEGELRLLKQFTYQQKKRELESEVEQTEDELERVKNRAEADIEKAKVELGTAQSNLERAERELADIQKDIDNCEITAPVAGRIVYAPQGNRWRQEEPVGVGDEVRLGQEIIHLPNPESMGVAIKIDESKRDKVEVGMPVMITGTNLSDGGLTGTLAKIATYLDPSGWWNNNQKVYSAEVAIDQPRGLRTGMNVSTRIVAQRLKDVVVVPVQSVVVHHERPLVFVRTDRGGLEAQPVEIGPNDGELVQIISGVETGEKVSMTPPLEPAGDTAESAEAAAPEREVDPATDEAVGDGNAAPAERSNDASASNATDDGESETEGPDDRQRRLAAFAKNLRDQGKLEEIDDAGRRLIDRLIRKTEAGEKVEFSENDRQALRGVMRQVMAGDGGRGGGEGQRGGGGRP